MHWLCIKSGLGGRAVYPMMPGRKSLCNCRWSGLKKITHKFLTRSWTPQVILHGLAPVSVASSLATSCLILSRNSGNTYFSVYPVTYLALLMLFHQKERFSFSFSSG